jgi:hypothetical protein
MDCALDRQKFRLVEHLGSSLRLRRLNKASPVGLILGGELAVVKAPIFDSLSFDPFTLLDDGSRPAEAGIGRCDVVQPLVIALMVVMLDDRFDLLFKVAA